MSWNAPEGWTPPPPVFDAADRAADFVEDDTVTVHRSRPAGEQPPPPPLYTAADIPARPGPPAPVASGAPVAPPVVSGWPPALPTSAPQQPAAPTAAQLVGDAVLLPAPMERLRSAAAVAPSDKEPKATRGARGVLASIGLPVGPGRVERAEREQQRERLRNEETIRQSTWTRPVAVLVANPKGGSGKTPVSLVLGGVLASIRGGSVAILEVSDDPNALAFRAEGAPRLGVGELVRDAHLIGSAGQLAGYTAPQTSLAHVIGSVGRRDRLDGEGVYAATGVLGRYYSVIVMDSGNQPTSSAFQGAVAAADTLVLPVMNAGDSALEVIRLLEELRDAGGHAEALAANAIAVLPTDGRPENAAVKDAVLNLLRNAGVTQFYELPYDAHIAERGQITLAKLAPATRDAATAAAAAVVSSLYATVSMTPNLGGPR